MFISFGAWDYKPEAKSITTTSMVSNVDSIPAECIIHENRNGVIVKRINNECAFSCINSYEEKITEIKAQNATFTNIDELLVRGAKVELNELRSILNAAERNDQDELYAMLAAMPDGATEIVFVLKTFDADKETMEFFNFTQPCPHACPW